MARSYRQKHCPVARALDIIGERWTILLLRDLFLQGPRRFQDFQESLAGVAPNTLSARLKAMESRA
jgi:DNA-binding HxlR family transcriptional regulator